MESNCAYIDTVNENLPLACLQSSEQRCRQRSLSRSRPTDNTDLLAWLDLEVDILQGEWQIVSVSCRVVSKLDGTFTWPVCRRSGFGDVCRRFRADIDILLDPLDTGER